MGIRMGFVCAILIAVLVACVMTGCITNSGEAKLVRPDGTEYYVNQKTMAAAGGRAKAADQQFVASYETEDGVRIEVKMGNNVEQPQSPDTVRGVTELVGALGNIVVPIATAPKPEPPPAE